MRIGYLTSCYPRASDSFVREEVSALRRLGHDVSTFAVRRPDPVEVELSGTEEELRRTRYLLDRRPAPLLLALAGALGRPRTFRQAVQLASRLRTPGVRGRLWPWAYLLEAVVLARLVRRARVEHLHDHISEGSAAVAMLTSALTGVPWSMTVHGPGEFERAERLHLDLKVGTAAFVVAISDYARGQLLRWTRPEDWSRVHVVPCGVAPHFLRAPAGPAALEPRVVCVARLDPVKGQRLLLGAIARLAEEGTRVEVTLIGDGPDRAALAACVEGQGLQDQVRLLGWANALTVQEEVLAAKALVLPSLAEGLPVVIMEALALGRPVIATDVAAVHDLVETGRTGWLVQPGDLEGLVSALRSLADADAETVQRMGTVGAQAVKDRHDIDAVARRLSHLFVGQPAGLP